MNTAILVTEPLLEHAGQESHNAAPTTTVKQLRSLLQPGTGPLPIHNSQRQQQRGTTLYCSTLRQFTDLSDDS